MTEEPDFIAQTAEPMTDDEGTAWFRARADEFKAEGATFGRFSMHETIPNLRLVEGWKVEPEDMGPIRWQFETPQPEET